MTLHDDLQRTLGHAYALENELGGGGMSRVFVAVEVALDRRVVVKVLPAEAAAAVSIERFKREIGLAARLQHPHIVPLLTAGESDGLPYFTMPLVEGESLRARLARQGELPVSDAVRLLREIASALAYAHDRGIIHRDIKPDNILLSGGSAMVTDFGVAKALSESSGGDKGSLTSLGVALGTPAYMSPEQATADPSIDHRADLYALGVLAYEMLTGQPVFAGRGPQHVLAAHVTEAPEPVERRRPGTPTPLAALVMRCLEKRAADRPQTAAEVVRALDAINTPSGGTPPTNAHLSLPPAKVAPPVSRRGVGITLVVIAVAAVVGGSAWMRVRGDAGHGAAAHRIVVLPPSTIGGAMQADVAEGIVEEVNSRLVGVRALEVIGRTTAERYRDTKLSPREIGAELGVGYVLALRIGRDAGDTKRLRVSTELLRASSEAAVWSKPYVVDSAADNVRMQADIAEQVAREMGVTIASDVQARMAARPTDNQEAYDEFLRGRPLVLSPLAKDIRTSVTVLEHAVELDPRFAAAWAALAIAHINKYWVATFDPAERSRAEVAATRASSLAPAAPETEFALGLIAYWGHLDYDGSLVHFRAAVAADPGRAEYQRYMAYPLRRSGRFEEALAALRRGNALGPRNADLLSDGLTWTLSLLGRFDEALVYADSAMILDPDAFYSIAAEVDALVTLGRVDQASRVATRALTERPGIRRLLVDQPSMVLDVAWLLAPAERARVIAGVPEMLPGVVDSTLYMLARAQLRDLAGIDARADFAEVARRLAVRMATQPIDPWVHVRIEVAYTGARQRDAAVQAGQRAIALYDARRDRYEGPDAHIAMALTHLAFGEREDAAREAELWTRANKGNIERLRYYPTYARLRELPRVQALVGGR